MAEQFTQQPGATAELSSALDPLKLAPRGFPGGSVVKNPSANAGDIECRRIQSLIWEDPTCCRATKPMHHNYWACALEFRSHGY